MEESSSSWLSSPRNLPLEGNEAASVSAWYEIALALATGFFYVLMWIEYSRERFIQAAGFALAFIACLLLFNSRWGV